jgi:hypothetical protein
MATVRGRSDVKRFMAAAPPALEKVLRGAGKAAATVIADEAKVRAPSDDVRNDIVTKSTSEPGQIVVRVTVKPGWGRSVGIWAEYGTAPHFITVDESQRRGRGIGRVNTQLREAQGDASLVIGGQFVGKTVFHPGARAIPFMRPALDTKEAEAVAAARTYIAARVRPSGVVGASNGDDA